ncbi:DNA-binding protein [Lentibacillus kapialis]|uniref:DNA-binding protein n=1 Tax=Lentibacillus kapialis TaxID=340214 RepID=A0A917UYE9_9BACI|nr:HEPN domain-containing protein [Lentibacillus kapialis]GGJ98675.1 DNA-binding protein [Lentibacillus kapialis]
MPYDKVSYWIDMADYDLKTAKAMLDTKRFLYVGFMCHQVIEKLLKVFFVFQKDEVPPYTHNLAYLTELIGLNEELSDEQRAFIRELRPLNIESRYPEDKDRIMQALDNKNASRFIQRQRSCLNGYKRS